MAVYLVTYDLNKAGKDYKSLYDEIQALGSWSHYLDSTWFVDTSLTATQIRDKLISVMDSNDYLFVTKVTRNYSGWLQTKAWDWLTDHVKD